jgi:hypothetical protein
VLHCRQLHRSLSFKRQRFTLKVDKKEYQPQGGYRASWLFFFRFFLRDDPSTGLFAVLFF